MTAFWKTVAVARKELRQIRRDRRTLLILLFVPLRENRSFLSTLVFLAALVLGVEIVRRITAREYPDEAAVEGDSSEPPAPGGPPPAAGKTTPG